MADFSKVTASHVEAACRRIVEEGVPAGRRARSTWVIFDGAELPAKYVLGLAYESATGRTLGPEDYTGGSASSSVLERLGFRVKHGRPAARSSAGIRVRERLTAGASAEAGKAGLFNALRARFGEVSTEKSLPWLRVPSRDALPTDLARIRRALVAHRGFDSFDTPGYFLRCDFFLPGAKAIVEVDERQHFTIPRALALRSYPPSVDLGFNVRSWIRDCERIAATDPTPRHRDEQRAYYDSVRDLLATRHGVRVFRVAETALATRTEIERVVATVASIVGNETAPPVVATACIAGAAAKTARENQGRIRLLRSVTREINKRGWLPTILLFPGGYFHLPIHVGHREHADRVRQLTGQGFSEACRESAQALGATVVAGVDSVPRRRRGFQDNDFRDELCVAWDRKSIVGVGRKVFPTDGQADDLVIYAADMATPHRAAPIGAGRSALLCSCYDMFGCSETARAPGKRSRNIRWFWTGSKLLERKHGGRVAEEVSMGVSAWEKLVRGATVGLAAIHDFKQRGEGSGKTYWQRHGIEKASTVLRGRLAFGAAHLEPPFPDCEKAVFAAKRGKRLPSVDCFEVSAGDGLSALVRLYRP